MINYIKEYWKLIDSGKEVVSKKIYKTYKYLNYCIDHQDKYSFSNKRAHHAIDFIEKYCKHSKGKMGGQPFKLELFQKAMISAIFGFVDINGNRQYTEAIFIVAKKNGKSLLASAIGVYMMIADGEAGAEVYAVATKKDQAKIIWQEAKRMIRKSPLLRKRIKTLVSELTSDYNDSTFKPLASDSDTLDGLNVHCCLADELQQWKNGKSLYDIMYDGIQAREQPLFLATTTAGTVREDIYDEKYEYAEKVIDGYFDENGYVDEHFIAFIYELDSKDEWTDEKCWKKANPALGIFKKVDVLKEKVNKAKSNPGLVKNLLCKEFNIRETTSDAWLSFETVDNKETYNINDFKDVYAVGGVDLSSTVDLTCATLMWRKEEKLFVSQMYFIPEELAEKKIREDKVPYDKWEKLGFLRYSGSHKIDYADVTKWFVEMRENHGIYPLFIGYDRWSASYWIQEMESEGFNLVDVIQGAKTMSTPMKIMESDFWAKKINYNNNPILKWCLTNTVVKRDENDNIRPVKGKNQKLRIDGTVSLIDAYVVYQENYEDFMRMTEEE
ncbi:terminase large subunit [Anaerorhabdus sp.]|uniref:terminase large subunit n=1 Tax=Anaerorhabdus sp. TaxID=1872524 RepID=UPI002FC6C0E5